METDPLDMVSALAPTTAPESDVLARVRSNLMDNIERSGAAQTGDTIPLVPKRRKRRRILPIAAAAVVLAVSGGTAWAVVANRNSAQTDNLSCPVPDQPNAESIVNVVTGDPIVDCANAWQESTDKPVPAMKAYDNGQGAVVVELADEPAPEGATPLDPGVHQNVDIRRIENRMADVGNGLAATCVDAKTAKSMVEGYLSDLDMTDWHVRIDPTPEGRSDGPCSYGGLDEAAKTVIVRVGLSADSFAENPQGPFAREVHTLLSAKCLDTGAAQAAIQGLADQTTIEVGDAKHGSTVIDLGEPDMIRYEVATDAGVKCTTATVTVGGAILVSLVGPAK